MICSVLLATTLIVAPAPVDTNAIRTWRAPGQVVHFNKLSNEAIFEKMGAGISRVLLSSGAVVLKHLVPTSGDVILENDGGGPSPDGKLYAMLSERHTEVVDLASGRVVARGNGSGRVLFTPDGRGLLRLGGNQFRCDLVSKSGWQPVWDVEFRGVPVHSRLAVAARTGLVAVALSGKVNIYRMTHTVGSRDVAWKSLECPAGDPSSLEFSPDGSMIVVGLGLREVLAWDVASRRCLWRRRPDGNYRGMSLGYSPDGRWLVSCGTRLEILDAASGKTLEGWYGHGPAGVWSAAFSPDQSILVSVGFDGWAKIWQVRRTSGP